MELSVAYPDDIVGDLIFLYNIHSFLKKLSNPIHAYQTLHPGSNEVVEEQLPKVYHVNIIMKNTFLDPSGEKAVELKKFRLVLDKNGILRIEQPQRNGNFS